MFNLLTFDGAAKPRKKKLINGKKLGVATRNWPVIAFSLAAILAFDVYSGLGIFLINKEVVEVFGVSVRLAPIEAAGSLLCGLLSLFGSIAASEMKSDPRPEQRNRAFGARCLSVMLLVAPVTYLGNALAFQAQTKAWEEYHGSEAHKAALAQSVDDTIDSLARRQAAVDLEKAIKPLAPKFDPFRWLWAAFLYGMVPFAAAAFHKAKPETEAEANRRLAALKAEQDRLIREAELKAEADARRAEAAREALGREPRNLFGIKFGQPKRVA